MILHPKDELGDFEARDIFKEEELFDVQAKVDKILSEIRAAVESVLKEAHPLSPVKVEAGVFRWSPICDEGYELEATLSFTSFFTKDPEEETQEINRLEDLIRNSKILSDLEKRIGEKVEICCYVPFELSSS